MLTRHPAPYKTLTILLVLNILAPIWAQNDHAAQLQTPRRTSVVDVFEKSKAAVVNIASKQIIEYRSPMGFDSLFERFFNNSRSPRKSRKFERLSVGSGFVLHKSGLIVTNAHVVAQTAQRKVIFDDNKEYDAQIVAIDHEHDLAVLKINVDHDIPTLPLGHSDDLMVGETVIAIGNALGYGHSVTSGVISALNRSVEINDQVAFKDLIQTDASINPGNSGGPLLNVLGELVGINTAIRADAQNIGFAIPVDDLRKLLPQMLAIENRSRLEFGIQVSDRGKRLRVVRVEVDSPAYKAGVQVGDQILQIDSLPITNAVNYAIALVDKKANDIVVLSILRKGKKQNCQVKITEKPKPQLAPLLESLFGLKVGVITSEIAKEARLGRIRGVFVIKVSPDSPADAAGLRRGDIITAMGDLRTTDTDNLALQLETIVAGDRVSIVVYRIGRRSYIRTRVILTAR